MMDDSPQPVLLSEEETDLASQLRKIRARVPKFYGVKKSEDGVHWTASCRYNGKDHVISDACETEMQAFDLYKNAKRVRRVIPENDETVDSLLYLASAYPVQFETSAASLWGSSLDPSRNRAFAEHGDVYETRRKR